MGTAQVLLRLEKRKAQRNAGPFVAEDWQSYFLKRTEDDGRMFVVLF